MFWLVQKIVFVTWIHKSNYLVFVLQHISIENYSKSKNILIWKTKCTYSAIVHNCWNFCKFELTFSEFIIRWFPSVKQKNSVSLSKFPLLTVNEKWNSDHFFLSVWSSQKFFLLAATIYLSVLRIHEGVTSWQCC